MDKKNEFDQDFDFEKEYGFHPDTILDPEYNSQEEMKEDFDASFDEAFIKDFDEKFGKDFNEKFAAEFGEEFAPVKEAEPEAPEFEDEVLEEDEESLIPDFVNTTFPSDEPTRILPAFDLPEYDNEKVIDPSVFEDTAPEAPAEDGLVDDITRKIDVISDVTAQEEKTAPAPRTRRKKMSRERLIKEVYLPPVILGVAALLCLVFIIGGVGRAIKGGTGTGGKENISTPGEDEATRLQKESQELLAKAA